jgi:TetR/AcrR family transcriptional regulator
VTRPVVKRGKGRPAAAGGEVGKEGLLRAARAVLRETPPALVTRQMVAERAGADPALVRYYFGTVENLIAEVAQATNEEVRQRIDAAKANAEPEDTLRARIEATLAMFLENPHHHEIMLRYQLGPRNGEIKERWRAGLASSLDEMKDILARGAAAGELRAVDERYLHLVVIGALQFFSNSEPLLKDMFGVSVKTEDIKKPFLEFLEELLLKGLEPRSADTPPAPVKTGVGKQRRP